MMLRLMLSSLDIHMATPLSTRLLDLARQNDSKAQYLYGKIRYLGRGVDKNLGDALNWLYRAAARGSMKVAYLIMKIYQVEHVDPIELEKAAESEQRLEEVTYPDKPNLVAEQSTREGQARLCRILVNDAMTMFTRKQFDDAAPLLLQAAKYGHKQAQALIANMYAEGLGVRRDSNEALYWSESAKSDKPLL